MPSVRTANAPARVPKSVAAAIAIGTTSHHGPPSEIVVIALVPRIAVRYAATPATVIWTRLTMPP